MEVTDELVFPDHHFYSEKDLSVIEEKAEKVDWVVTTDKDMVKLRKFDISHLPIRAFRIQMKIWEEEEFYRKVMELF